jgi:hypothetical protein
VLKNALETGISVQSGSVENHGGVGVGGGGKRLPGTLIVEGGLWKRSISLYGSSVRGTWRVDPLLGTLQVV